MTYIFEKARKFSAIYSYRREDGTIGGHIIRGHDVKNNVGMYLTAYFDKRFRLWYLLEGVSGIAIGYGYTFKDAVNMFTRYITKSGGIDAVQRKIGEYSCSSALYRAKRGL